MNRETALRISEALADHGNGIPHRVEFDPNYGYTVTLPEREVNSETRDVIDSVANRPLDYRGVVA